MDIDVKVPRLPDSVSDAQIAHVYVNQGQEVAFEQSLFDVETDKVVLEVVAPVNGIIESIHLSVGDDVSSEQVVMQMRETETSAQPPASPAAKETVFKDVVVEKADKSELERMALEQVVGNSLFDRRGIICGMLGVFVGVFIGAIGAAVLIG